MKELKEKNITDLKTLLAEKRESVRAFRFGMAGSTSRNVKATRTTKREIARILTEMTLRSKEASKATAS